MNFVEKKYTSKSSSGHGEWNFDNHAESLSQIWTNFWSFRLIKKTLKMLLQTRRIEFWVDQFFCLIFYLLCQERASPHPRVKMFILKFSSFSFQRHFSPLDGKKRSASAPLVFSLFDQWSWYINLLGCQIIDKYFSIRLFKLLSFNNFVLCWWSSIFAQKIMKVTINLV